MSLGFPFDLTVSRRAALRIISCGAGMLVAAALRAAAIHQYGDQHEPSGDERARRDGGAKCWNTGHRRQPGRESTEARRHAARRNPARHLQPRRAFPHGSGVRQPVECVRGADLVWPGPQAAAAPGRELGHGPDYTEIKLNLRKGVQ